MLSDYAGTLSQQGQQQAQYNDIKAPRPTDVFDELRSAQAEYHAACHAFANASVGRDKASAHLQDLSEKASRVIQGALQDPTVPQAECVQTRPNGRY